ncbi:MAG: dolichyl-phosphate beta-glucosyltransferase [Candidatus Andersenbacteria bacterium]
MPAARPYLSVIIPMYNEEQRLAATVRAVVAYLEEHRPSFEVLLVDDGSTDGSVALAHSLAAELPNLAVITHPRNLGKGASVQDGLREAQGEYLLYMDADHSTNIAELRQLPRLIARGADVMVSSRYVPGSRITSKQPWQRVVVSRVANFVIRLFAVPGIHDTQNGFKILRGTAARDILPHLLLRRWAFDVELLYVARRLGYRVVEFPVTWHHTPGSKLNIGRDLRNTVGEFWKFIWNRLRGRYPKRLRARD